MPWMRRVGPGSPKVTELVQGAQRAIAGGGCMLSYVLCSVLSLRTLHLSYGSQGGPITQVHSVKKHYSWILVLPLGQVTSKERNTFLDSYPG